MTNTQVTRFYKTRGISYCIVKYENARAVEEFRGSILATTAWFEVLAVFHFCFMYFLLFREQRNVNNSVALGPNSLHMISRL